MIFKLIREDGLKYKEVADILNISVKTVDAQMVIAVGQIKEKLKGHLLMPSRKNFQKN
jgi:RNA polymerase sigma-70 factor (ECF subfamily)